MLLARPGPQRDLLEPLHRSAAVLETSRSAGEDGRRPSGPDRVGQIADRAGDRVGVRGVPESRDPVRRLPAGAPGRFIEVAGDDVDDPGKGREIGRRAVPPAVRAFEYLGENGIGQQVRRRQDAHGLVADDEGFRPEVAEAQTSAETIQHLVDDDPQQADRRRRVHRGQRLGQRDQVGVRQKDVDAVIAPPDRRDRLDHASLAREEGVAHREILDGDRDVIGGRQREQEKASLAQGIGDAETAPGRIIAEDPVGLVAGNESLIEAVVRHCRPPRLSRNLTGKNTLPEFVRPGKGNVEKAPSIRGYRASARSSRRSGARFAGPPRRRRSAA